MYLGALAPVQVERDLVRLRLGVWKVAGLGRALFERRDAADGQLVGAKSHGLDASQLWTLLERFGRVDVPIEAERSSGVCSNVSALFLIAAHS